MMKKNLLLGLAGVAMAVGCQCDCCKRGKETTGVPVQGVSQAQQSTTQSLAGRTMQQQPTSAQVLGAQQVAPQQMTPQNPGMIMPNSMAGKPTSMDSMSR